MSWFVLVVILLVVYAIVCLCALCFCRGVFHYLCCRCFCKKKAALKSQPKTDPRDAKKYPSSISVSKRGDMQTLIPTPRKSASTLSLTLASEGGPPGLTSTSPSTADPDTPTLKSIKIEGVSPMDIAVPCLEGLSGPIDVPEPYLSSSDSEPEPRLEISLTPCTEATDAALEGRKDSTAHPDVEVVVHAPEASIGAASGKDNENTSSTEVDVVVPATDASIATAVEIVRSSWTTCRNLPDRSSEKSTYQI